MKKYSKNCPSCGTTKISVNPAYGMKCNKCPFKNKIHITDNDIKFTRGG